MLERLAARTLLGLALWLGPLGGVARAEPVVGQAAAAGTGVIIVAIGDAASEPARALAHGVYRDAALRPGIDDRTARVLAGEAPPPDAPAELRELAELVASVGAADSEAVSRRLLASLGSEHRAALVVTVAMHGERPVARILRVATSSFERLDLGGAIETSPEGSRRFLWPGATELLRGLLSPKPAPAKTEPIKPVPARTPAPAPQETSSARPFWYSPWFWGPLAGVTAAGLSVLIAVKASESDPEMVRMKGRVAP
jgi:hypothetical protein